MMQSPTADEGRWHVAIIMDGNGRWATRRGLPRSAGHRAGVQAVRKVVEAAPDLGVATLTLFAFSSDNWRRPQGEVKTLMSLLRHYLRADIRELIDNGVRLTVIGRRDRLPGGLAQEIAEVERASAHPWRSRRPNEQRRAIDTGVEIGLLGKLKLAKCADPGPIGNRCFLGSNGFV